MCLDMILMMGLVWLLKYDMLSKSLMFEVVILILQVLMTSVYHIKILAQHERALNTALQNTQYSFKNQRPMHGNDENILF